MVVTSAPWACTANMAQDLTARPLTCTVQAPHWLVSQPTWVPVSARCSRSAWTSRVLGGTSMLAARPLTVNCTCISLSPVMVMAGFARRILERPRPLPPRDSPRNTRRCAGYSQNETCCTAHLCTMREDCHPLPPSLVCTPVVGTPKALPQGLRCLLLPIRHPTTARP